MLLQNFAYKKSTAFDFFFKKNCWEANWIFCLLFKCIDVTSYIICNTSKMHTESPLIRRHSLKQIIWRYHILTVHEGHKDYKNVNLVENHLIKRDSLKKPIGRLHEGHKNTNVIPLAELEHIHTTQFMKARKITNVNLVVNHFLAQDTQPQERLEPILILNGGL